MTARPSARRPRPAPTASSSSRSSPTASPKRSARCAAGSGWWLARRPAKYFNAAGAHRSSVRTAADQHLALADMVGLADHALGLHALDQARRAVVADLQIALDEAGRGLALARHQRDRLVVEIVARAAALLIEAALAAAELLVLGDRLDIGRLALVFQKADHLLDLGVGHERAVHAGDAAAAGHVEHVA